MAIQYKVDVIALLREKGYTSYRIRKERLINETALQRLRDGKLIAWEQLSNICHVLNCQPGELIEYIEDTPEEESASAQ